ncbi:MAG: anaerobic sulfatase maturase [Desulfobulbaceae bacterium]|nr:anaerobic sulfatase maturase [Desulfobulbaceae bacterium]
MIKPIGPQCNLNCEYCYYLEKKDLFPDGENFIMPNSVLSACITKYLSGMSTTNVEFIWQGGEPTLLGLDFYKQVIELQMPFAKQKVITNSIQTNGTLLDDKWCEFLVQNNFLVGLSLDGPKAVHDRYRKDHNGQPTFDRVMRGLKLLQKYGVEYNVMATVARETAHSPNEIYRFFKEQGVQFLQFTPVVERTADSHTEQLGLKLAGPLSLCEEEGNTTVTQWSVEPEVYGNFLITIFDQWVRNDVGSTYVMNFDWALNSWIGNPSPVCQFSQTCGQTIMLEHNGDTYACDHNMYPEYKKGNIADIDHTEIIENMINKGFHIKDTNLPDSCLKCKVLKACWCGCPKHRFIKNQDGKPALNYLCKGYKRYFLYIRKYLHAMSQLLENGLPASHIMLAFKGPIAINVSKNNNGV